MFSSNRNELRKVFFEAWRKHLQQLPVEPLEAQLIAIILLHPEYQRMLAEPAENQDEDFLEGNPFLHLGLHLALHEQVSTDRPLGIKKIHHDLCLRFGDLHLAEHKMMDCLAEVLWRAQKTGGFPDEANYLESLRNL